MIKCQREPLRNVEAEPPRNRKHPWFSQISECHSWESDFEDSCGHSWRSTVSSHRRWVGGSQQAEDWSRQTRLCQGALGNRHRDGRPWDFSRYADLPGL